MKHLQLMEMTVEDIQDKGAGLVMENIIPWRCCKVTGSMKWTELLATVMWKTFGGFRTNNLGQAMESR